MEEKRVLIVIAPRRFRDEELAEPLHYLEKDGISYDVVSSMKGLAVGMLGGQMLVEKSIAEVLKEGIASYGGIIIVGGGGSVEYLWNDRSLISLVRLFEKEEKIISAICLSPAVLAQAGVLKGKKATVWIDDAAIEEIRKGGGTFVSQPVVSDGKIITANGPPASGAFGEKVAKAILSENR
jgi:protease I